MCENNDDTLQSLSIKSFSPSQIEEAMARAVARLTGQENVSCEINNLEYSSIRTSFFEEMESHTDTFTATIKIKGDRKAIDKKFKDFIEGRE